MYYGSSRSSSYGRSSTSYNFSSDLSLSSLTPRNPSIQRVINSDYGSRDRSLSPSRGLASPTFRRRDFSETERSSPVSFSNDLDYSVKPRSYYDFPSTSSTILLTSFSSPIKKPKRTDYSDYLRPVLTTRPMLKSGYSPRSRRERESVSTPLTRDRKLIKFREVSDEVLEKIRRKISWDLPEEISSPLIDEMKQKYPEPVDDTFAPEQSSSRRGSKDGLISNSGSPKLSLSRRSSGDQPVRPPMRKNSRSGSLITSAFEERFELEQDHSKVPIPPPRKKSLTSSSKGKTSRKSSVDILLSEEKTQNYSKIAEDIRRNREISERIKKLAEESVDEGKQQSQLETEYSAENKSLPASKETVVPDRGRRRRRGSSIPKPDIIEEPPPEVRKRVRSRYKSRESSQSISPSLEIKSKSNESFNDETPRVTSRMHRKSVKYKSEPRRPSKCNEILGDSTISHFKEISSVNESKSSTLENKDFASIPEKNDTIKTPSKPFPDQKQTTDNKIKHEENQTKRNFCKTSEKSVLEENKVPSTQNKDTEIRLGKSTEKCKEKTDNEIGGNSLNKICITDKFKSLDQNRCETILNTNISKSKNSENESKAGNKHSLIKDELKILNIKVSKASVTENKDSAKKVLLNKNLDEFSKSSSKDICDNLLNKGTLGVCLNTLDNAKNIPEDKILCTEKISKSQEKPLNCKTTKYDKREEKPKNTCINEVKKTASKESLEENFKRIAQKEQIENCKDTNLLPIFCPPNDIEEVVIVCKLPKKTEVELKKNIPDEPKVVVSIKNSEIKGIESKIESPSNTVPNADKIIPAGANQTTKLQNCDIKRNVDILKTEAADVNVTHTIVLKPKASETSITNKSKTGKDVHLKSIPDVIESTVYFGSKENDISDVVKSTLFKTNGQSETKTSALLLKNELTQNIGNKNANDMRKNEELAPISEKTSKDKTLLQKISQESITSKTVKKNKDLLDVKKSSSVVFDTTKEISDMLNIKKSSSETLDDSKAVKKSLDKPDLIQMTVSAIKKPEAISNLDKLSINKESVNKNCLSFESKISGSVCDSGKHGAEPMKKNNSENSNNEIASINSKVTTVQGDNLRQQLESKIIEQKKGEEKHANQKSKTESSSAKEIPKQAKTGKFDSEISIHTAQIGIITDKTKEVLKISSSENAEHEVHSKLNKDLTKKIGNKNAVSDPKTPIENAKVMITDMKSTTFGDQINKKQTIPAYKKSMTLPNVNTTLDEYNNAIEKAIAESNAIKNENIEMNSLSTSDVPRTLGGKNSFESHNVLKNRKTNAVTFSNKQTNSLEMNKRSTDILQLPKMKSNDIKQDLVETSKETKLSEFDKKLNSAQLLEDNANQEKLTMLNKQDQNKNQSQMFPKLKNEADSKLEKSVSEVKLNEIKNLKLTKITAGVENKNNLNEKSKETFSHKRNENQNTGTSIQRTEVDKKILPPEILNLAPTENASKLVTHTKHKENLLPRIKSLDTTSQVDNSMKNKISSTNCENKALQSKERNLNSYNIENSKHSDINLKSDKSSEISVKESTTDLKDKCVTEQKVSMAAKSSVPPKPNKIKQIKIPEYKRYGLIIRPKEPPKTILESSSSDEEETETESTSEDETLVTKRTNIPNECNVVCHQKCERFMPNLCGVNQKLLSEVLDKVKKGKYPERSSNDYSPKQRSHSETSNTSVSSTCSISTICTTIQEPWDDSPQKLNQRLKFRKYGVEDFSFLKLLGKGSFGKGYMERLDTLYEAICAKDSTICILLKKTDGTEVLLAELKDSNMYFAIKCLKKDVVLEDDDVESTMIERRVLALGTQHPYMCKLYCTFQTKSYLYFVMEYLNGGDLMFHIQESGRFEEKRAAFYGAEIVSALKFLHKRGIVYRDIKLDNLMLDQQGHIRLVDFGMCQCRIYKEECMPSNFCGTPTYIAPEIVLGQKYNESVDWWSFGVLLYEMLIGRSPFQGTDEDELFWSICNEEPHYPRFLSKEATHILGLLLVKSPSKRLGMPSCPAGDIKDHAFFKNIDWNKIENKETPPVFKPAVSGPCDTSNFDSSFTMDTAVLSPVDSDVLKSMDQEQFNGFSYTNPHLTG